MTISNRLASLFALTWLLAGAVGAASDSSDTRPTLRRVCNPERTRARSGEAIPLALPKTYSFSPLQRVSG